MCMLCGSDKHEASACPWAGDIAKASKELLAYADRDYASWIVVRGLALMGLPKERAMVALGLNAVPDIGVYHG